MRQRQFHRPLIQGQENPGHTVNSRLKRAMLAAAPKAGRLLTCMQGARFCKSTHLRETSMSFSIESKLGDLLDNDATKAILEKHMPGISTHPQIGMGKGFALSMVAKFSGGLITEEMLQKVGADLTALG